MSIDARLKSGLASATASTKLPEQTDIALIKERGDRLRQKDRFTRGAIGTLVVLAVIVALLAQSGTNDVYVADGETLLSTNPLVVQGAASPEPLFDTTQLGVEQPLTPLTSIERAVELAQQTIRGDADSEIVRILTVGTTVGGLDSILLHYEWTSITFGADQVSRRVQSRCVATNLGSTCGGSEVEDAAGEPGGLLQRSTNDPPVYAVGGEADFTWEVPGGTSVVVLTINGESVWQRPIGGVAVFDSTIVGGDVVEYVALDANGLHLKRGRSIA